MGIAHERPRPVGEGILPAATCLACDREVEVGQLAVEVHAGVAGDKVEAYTGISLHAKPSCLRDYFIEDVVAELVTDAKRKEA